MIQIRFGMNPKMESLQRYQGFVPKLPINKLQGIGHHPAKRTDKNVWLQRLMEPLKKTETIRSRQATHQVIFLQDLKENTC